MKKILCIIGHMRLGVRLGRTSLTSLIAAALLCTFNARAQSPVVQRGYDANVSGATLVEKTLNTSNVTPSTFGLLFKLPVDDAIFAQVLYVPKVVINQVSHNVIYVATMSDTLYAFDADTGGSPLWKVNLASLVGAQPVPVANFAFAGNKNIVGNLGILSTPVIDLSSNTIYAVTGTLENSTVVYRLHALDITSGNTRSHSGVKISGSYGGSTFDGRYQWQRPALVIAANQIVIGFAAFELESAGSYVGWMMAYDKKTLARSGLFATVTSGNRGGGVWQSGRPPVVDGAGFVYVFTGNGYGNGYDGVNDFSETVLKLDPAHGLALVDWFTPSNWASLDTGDLDLSSSGPLLIPGTQLIAGGGKSGDLFVLNTANLGKNNAPAQQVHIASGSIRGGPVYWKRSTANGGPLMYDWAVNDQLKAFPFDGSTFAATPSAKGNVLSQIYPGGILTLSANGDAPGSGVLWASVAASGEAASNPPVSGTLYAFDAGNVANQLWNSTMNGTRDSFGNFAKFVPPMVASGKVYVPTWSNQVAVYGLRSADASAPSLSPAPGTYNSPQSVSLSSGTIGASIYYTTNGTTPSATPGELYTGPIPVNSSLTIQAIAVASGFSNSRVTSGTYTITPPAAAPSLMPSSGVYGSTQSVLLTSNIAGASIYYTTDGTVPSVTPSELYSGPIAVNSSLTIQAIAVASGYSSSPVASGTYTIILPAAAPAFSPAPGAYTGAQSVSLTSSTSGANIYYTTDGTAPAATPAELYSAPIPVNSSMTIQAIAVANGFSNSSVASGKYTITPPVVVAPTTMQLAIQPKTVSTSDTVTFTATVTATGSSVVPKGEVTFLDGGSVMGKSTLDAGGTASYSMSGLKAGAHDITASYGGDSVTAPSVSSPTKITVSDPSPPVVVTPPPATGGSTSGGGGAVGVWELLTFALLMSRRRHFART